MVKKVKERISRQQRKQARQSLGKLGEMTVMRKTRARYEAAFTNFLVWCERHGHGVEKEEVIQATCDWVEEDCLLFSTQRRSSAMGGTTAAGWGAVLYGILCKTRADWPTVLYRVTAVKRVLPPLRLLSVDACKQIHKQIAVFAATGMDSCGGRVVESAWPQVLIES